MQGIYAIVNSEGEERSALKKTLTDVIYPTNDLIFSRDNGSKTLEIIQVIAIGSDVLVGGDIPAKVLAVTIGEGYLAYKCAWWDDRQRYVEWIPSIEVSERVQNHRTIIKGLR